MNGVHRFGWSAFAACLAIGLVSTGCGTPGAPMPPSLNLPDPVTNLSASRTGNGVSLTWTMPKKNTDKLLLKGNVPVHVCRKEGSEICEPVSNVLVLAPGVQGAFTEELPPALTKDAPRPLTYFVELNNRNGRSAGLSNPAVVLAGESPSPVVGLSALVRKDGVALRWTLESETAAIRLHRKLLTPQQETRPRNQEGPLAPPPEPLD